MRNTSSKLIEEAEAIGRCLMHNSVSSGENLSGHHQSQMQEFLARIRQVLPVMGCDLLLPNQQIEKQTVYVCAIKGLIARGYPTRDGFLVLQGSEAVGACRPSAPDDMLARRKQLLAGGVLEDCGNCLRFKADHSFSSPSAAAAVIHGGSANGLIAWKTTDGVPLKKTLAERRGN